MRTPPPAATHDVIVLGGGMAGLTLALQLRQRLPELDVLVLERRRHPVPEAAHKVGESSVEIGAHYLSQVLGLEHHLAATQLKKFGFRFFFSDGQRDIAAVTELGASGYLSTPTYQLDRGIFENDLGRLAADRGIRFADGALVRDFTLADGDAAHRVEYQHGGVTHHAACRWLIDASGRAGLLKRRLDLAEANEHAAHAVWLRIGARIDIDEWSNDAAWLQRCKPPHRWLSTTHLVGDGYWVWLIPLASGSHSVGIVADPALHPLERMNTFERALDWLQQRQPQLFDELAAKRDRLQDFRFLRNFSYGCKQVFSGRQRWALTGEAGLFLDPFYSPGGDFIAIANTYITELVVKDRAGDAVALYAAMYQRIYFSFYEAMLPLYVGQYPIFGDAEVMPVKVLWDYTYYWGVMCQLFFQNRLTDIAAIGRLQEKLVNARLLNTAMQQFLRSWSASSRRANPAQLLDQAELGWFTELNRGLTDRLDQAGFDARLEANLAQLAALAAQIVGRATAEHARLDGAAVRALLAADAGHGHPAMLFAHTELRSN